VLPELGPAGEHLLQLGPVELDHVRRFDGYASADCGLTREHRDVTDERATVRLGDVDVLAWLAIYELNEPPLDDEERRVADGVLVENLTGRHRPASTPLAQPRQLGVGQAREIHLISKVRELFTADHLCRRHRTRLQPLCGASGGRDSCAGLCCLTRCLCGL
jgi:hypothetical protein